ncbi:MAG: hypothetical protein A2133_00680 [Actinobacteria bacterium RBG_16_64_13]|nr:MAG: hypothetical protein A2133_00680 [Actinobacteria bacterium RBG_16_64_13]
MRLRELCKGVGLAAAVLGVGASLAMYAGGCAEGQATGIEPAASEGDQAAAQPQLPALDVEAPREFQTASFAFG